MSQLNWIHLQSSQYQAAKLSTAPQLFEALWNRTLPTAVLDIHPISLSISAMRQILIMRRRRRKKKRR